MQPVLRSWTDIEVDDEELLVEWLNGYTDVPIKLQGAFRIKQRVSRHKLVHPLAEELDLRTDDMELLPGKFLLEVANAIGDADPNDGGTAIAGVAVEQFHLLAIIEIMQFFDWGKTMIQPSPVSRIEVEIQGALAAKIGARLEPALRRWKALGI